VNPALLSGHRRVEGRGADRSKTKLNNIAKRKINKYP
jgi:hypothetical protein